MDLNEYINIQYGIIVIIVLFFSTCQPCIVIKQNCTLHLRLYSAFLDIQSAYNDEGEILLPG